MVLARTKGYPRTRRAMIARAMDFVLSCMALDKALGWEQALLGLTSSVMLLVLRKTAAAHSSFLSSKCYQLSSSKPLPADFVDLVDGT